MRHSFLRRTLGVLIGTAACAATAFAQAPPSPHQPNPPTATQPSQPGCAQSQLQVAPSQKPGEGSATTHNAPTTNGKAPLSDKLAQSGGVICPPPGVDPEIRTPAPDVGRMPVIPPPGTPGGNPNVQPK